ncbi:HAD-IA family hydrolase [Enterovibrio makurazakiensis]|uniref:phosphoglycolate phosphatase n=1 Tax=Enterovibrio gelatinilyticus TaxID=2899819 RepID=A0ABT5R2L5_9GAMM|nr:HAD-IA family hydrolase [Enterovibrio sp. ZSDZ42]MDD1794513.1 HAD-IA family hydrolase [Enterovibrio sp. ZSDZ42]
MLPATEVKAVVFELDGTLVDTAEDVCMAAKEMLADLHLPSLNTELVRDWIGDGTDRLVHRILSRKIDGVVPDSLFRIGSALFLKAYQRRNHAAAELYPGVEACLRQLTRKNVPMVVVTNQATSLANDILIRLGIRNHFALVLGRDALQEPKPSPDGLLEAALLLQLNPDELMVVGGSVNDVNAARAAGCPVVCVSYGFNYGVDIRYSAPDEVLDSLASFPAYLNKGLSKPAKTKLGKSGLAPKLAKPINR